MSDRDEREETANTIMDSAIALIAQSGIATMRLQDVAAHAGLSVGGIQYHFSSRSDLVDQALQRHALESIEAISVDRGDLCHWQVLDRTLNAIAERSELEARDRVWVMLNASALTTREHLKLVHSIQTKWRVLLHEVVSAGVSAGEFVPGIDAVEVVERLLVMVDGYAMANSVYGIASPDTVQRMSAGLRDVAHALLRPESHDERVRDCGAGRGARGAT